MGRRTVFIFAIAALIFSITGTAYAGVSGATNAQTSGATTIMLIVSCIFIVAGVTLALRRGGDYKNGWSLFWAAAAAAAVIYIFTAAFYPGYKIDMDCFRAWSNSMYAGGPSGFYGSLEFADYPPGYMYILWVIGFLRNLFGFGFGSPEDNVLLRLPAIISVIVLAALVFRIASNEAGKRFGLFCSFLILFNPALFFNSGVWGQIDPVFALFIVLSLYWLKKENYLKGAFFFAVALLIKPQAILFAPVVGLAFLYSLFKRCGLKKALAGIFGGAVIIGGVLVLGTLPFTAYQPKTSFTLDTAGDFIVNLREPSEIKYVKYMASGEGSFSLSYGNDYGEEAGVTVRPSGSAEDVPFKAQLNEASPVWRQTEVTGFGASYIDIHVDEPGLNIYEIAFYNSSGAAVFLDSEVPVYRVNPGNGIPRNMVDEQLYPSVHGYDFARWLINKYTGTIGSYPYATINAFNLFALLGGNWTKDTTTLLIYDFKTWGIIFLVIICAAVALIQWKTRARRPYFSISAFLIISLFMLMNMVHERYIVPACVLLVFAYAYSRDTSDLVFTGLWSAAALLNQLVVLNAETTAAPEGPMIVLSAINVALYAVYAVFTVKKLLSGKVLIKSPALHG